MDKPGLGMEFSVRLPSICEVPTSISDTGSGGGDKALTAPCILVQYTKQETNTEESQKDKIKKTITIPLNMCVCVCVQPCARSEARGGCQISVSTLFPIPHLQCHRLLCAQPHLAFYVTAEDLNSGPHACSANCLTD